MPYPYGNPFPGTPRWQARGDTIDLVWSNGFSPTMVKLVRYARVLSAVQCLTKRQ